MTNCIFANFPEIYCGVTVSTNQPYSIQIYKDRQLQSVEKWYLVY